MLRARIAVLVSGGGTNLQALIDAQESGSLSCGKLALVISSKPSVMALERARFAGIPSLVIEGGDEAALCQALQAHETDVIVLAGYLRILSADFIRRYEGRIINVHPSLIPAFCGKGYYGLRVHEAALARGVKVTGATVHIVNEIPDGGRILMQKAVDVLDGDTPQTLQKRVMEQAEWVLLPKATEQLCREYLEGKGNA